MRNIPMDKFRNQPRRTQLDENVQYSYPEGQPQVLLFQYLNLEAMVLPEPSQ